MPNNITNKLKINADKDLIKTIKDYLKIDYEDITVGMDFNKIIPMPKSLNMTAGSIEDIALSVYIIENPESERKIIKSKDGFFLKSSKEDVLYYLAHNKEESYEKLLELGKRYYKNIIYYGFSTWYDWRTKIWGTKWNAYKCDLVNTEDTIYFLTAWQGVPRLIEILSYRFPNAEFEYYYADEDFGYNVGHYRFKNGNKFEETIEGGTPRAYDLACEIMQTTLEENCINENYEYDESLEEE